MSSSAEEAVKAVAQAERVIAMLKLERDDVVINLVPIDIRVVMKEVEAEYATKILGWEAELEAAKAEAVTRVLAARETCTVDGLQAVWSNGRRGAWDDDRIYELIKELGRCHVVRSLKLAELDRYADALEAYLGDFANALLKARKPDGQPTVSFRTKQEKK